jgi:hypothetical protein
MMKRRTHSCKVNKLALPCRHFSLSCSSRHHRCARPVHRACVDGEWSGCWGRRREASSWCWLPNDQHNNPNHSRSHRRALAQRRGRALEVAGDGTMRRIAQVPLSILTLATCVELPRGVSCPCLCQPPGAPCGIYSWSVCQSQYYTSACVSFASTLVPLNGERTK